MSHTDDYTRRLTLAYSYGELKGLLATLREDHERIEASMKAPAAHEGTRLAGRFLLERNEEHTRKLKEAWEAGEETEPDGEQRGIVIEIEAVDE